MQVKVVVTFQFAKLGSAFEFKVHFSLYAIMKDG